MNNNSKDHESGHTSKSKDQIGFEEEEEKEIQELRQTLNTNFDIEPSHEKYNGMQSLITTGCKLDDQLLEETMKGKKNQSTAQSPAKKRLEDIVEESKTP